MADLPDNPPAYARSLALGFVCGLRSMLGPALVADLAPPPVRLLFRLLSAGEVIADKLPGIPSRIAPGPLAGRLVSGMAVGGVVCHAAGKSPLVGGLLGGAAALAGSYGGYYGRKALGTRLHLPDPVVALAEDALAAGLGRRFGP